MKNLLHKHLPFLIMLVTVCISLLSMGFYTGSTLQGNMDNYILSADMFGTPKALVERGISPMYHGKSTGWDGQFYYYIANDPLGLKDTAEHLDAPSYRYQRIGLPLYTKLLSLVTFQDWVSPLFYYLSYLLLVAAATYAAATLFKQRGFFPGYALLWSLGVGTQLTLLNALPDAAADAFMILAIAAFLSERWFLYTLSMLFSALSREAYIIIPFVICLVSFVMTMLSASADSCYKKLWMWIKSYAFITHIIIGVVFVCWQLYIYLHFHATPSSQAFGILGAPFESWYKYLVSGIEGNHLLVGAGYHAYAEAAFLVFFLILCLLTAASAIQLIRSNPSNIKTVGLATGILTMVLLYFCFGDTVIMHYTGYLKAANLFFFILPLFVCLSGKRFPWYESLFLFSAAFILYCYFWKWRILASYTDLSLYTNSGKVLNNQKVPCFSSYDSNLKLVRTEEITDVKGLMGSIFARKIIVYYVEVENTGRYPLVSSTELNGSVSLSAQMFPVGRSKVFSEGFPTYILEPIKPNEKRVIPFVTQFPWWTKHYVLKISLIQEGCAWFYNANPKSVLVIDDPMHSLDAK